MKKILLLNPPAEKKFHRDYYCSHSIKGDFLWQPLDLQILSGFLKNQYKILVIDSMYYNYSSEKVLNKILIFNPDVIISQVGAACLNSDMEFLKKIKTISNIKLAVTGDVCRAENSLFLNKYKFIDAVIYNIIENDICKWIENSKSTNLINIITQNSFLIKEAEDNFKIPMPDFKYFIKKNYKLPVAKHTSVYTVLSNFGCPYRCNFCHFEQIPEASRNLDNFEKELKIIKKYGVRELHFRDQTFGYDLRYFDRLLKIIKKYEFKFIADTRADIMDYNKLLKLKKSGLDTIEVGVESGNYKTRKKFGKDIDDLTYINFFNNCKKLKIKTLAFFIIGFPGETNKEIYKTWKFIKKLSPDYLSINIFVPKQGTTMDNFLLKEEDRDPTMGFSSEKLRIIRTMIAFSFYFSPLYILKKMKKIESFDEFVNHLFNAVFFVKSHLNIFNKG